MDIKKPQLGKVEAFARMGQLFRGVLQHPLEALLGTYHGYGAARLNPRLTTFNPRRARVIPILSDSNIFPLKINQYDMTLYIINLYECN